MLLFKIIFGSYFPIYIIGSNSMSPTYDVGDIIFIDGKNNEYIMNNDIIIYYPYGNYKSIPIIHRAIYYVYKGEPLCLFGPIA